jgi:hypothetical protein
LADHFAAVSAVVFTVQQGETYATLLAVLGIAVGAPYHLKRETPERSADCRERQ